MVGWCKLGNLEGELLPRQYTALPTPVGLHVGQQAEELLFVKWGLQDLIVDHAASQWIRKFLKKLLSKALKTALKRLNF